MRFNVGDVVKIHKDDLLRGGESATVKQVLQHPEFGPIHEYVVEFQNRPQRLRSSDRFLFSIYREEELID